jgi:opacity protein-like surface antigen
MIFSRILCVAAALVMLASSARAQVAPVPYWSAPFGFAGGTAIAGTDNEQVTFYGTTDEDGFRKGFSFRSYSYPVSALASGFALSGLTPLGSAGLASSGAQYGYSFRGAGDLPVTLFGGVNSLRTTQDVFSSLVNPGFDSSRTLATSVQAGIEFKPTSNMSLSLSANVVQAAPSQATDLRSQLIQGYR